MDLLERIDNALDGALARLVHHDCPDGLAAAMRFAVSPGGSRLRPRLVVAVADACDAQDAALVDAAAVGVEFLHCASLIQDDLQCFDDAATRRGKPTVHRAFDERLAILASDALIVGAFDVVASVPSADPAQCLALTRCFARRVGAAGGITAGQAWECETTIDLPSYHKAKTGALFAAATEAGAIAAGHRAEGWGQTGELMGCAYQVADDLRDYVSTEKACGKPVGVDALLGRPNAADKMGVEEAVARLKSILKRVVDTVPECPHADQLIAIIHHEASRFLPAEVARSAA